MGAAAENGLDKGFAPSNFPKKALDLRRNDGTSRMRGSRIRRGRGRKSREKEEAENKPF